MSRWVPPFTNRLNPLIERSSLTIYLCCFRYALAIRRQIVFLTIYLECAFIGVLK